MSDLTVCQNMQEPLCAEPGTYALLSSTSTVPTQSRHAQIHATGTSENLNKDAIGVKHTGTLEVIWQIKTYITP